MTQGRFEQEGTFHVTTNTQNKSPWCTFPCVPELLIDNLRMTANVHKALIIEFCILPDHLHLLFETGLKGLSAFMHSFKTHSSKDVQEFLRNRAGACTRAPGASSQFTGWQRGFHDERIRNEDQMRAVQRYILHNAYNHGLSSTTDDWPWTSMKYEEMTIRRFP